MKPQPPKPAFEVNHFYERVIELRRANPAAFDSLAPPTKLALGQYEAQKREAARLQAIRDEAAKVKRELTMSPIGRHCEKRREVR